MEEEQGEKILGTVVFKGIKRRNLMTYYFAAVMTIMMAVLMNVLQPYVLTNFLGIDELEQGEVAGTASMVGEFVLIPFVFIWGIGSDYIGRRNVYVLGFVFEGIGYLLIPFMPTLEGYFFARGVWAIGSAATTGMLATILGDYVTDEDRGKATGIMGFCNAIGAAVAAVALARLPGICEGLGIKSDDGIAQGQASYTIVFVMCLIVAVVLRSGLAGRETEKASDEIVPLKECIVSGVGYARNDKYIALAYVTAFVARADLAMAGVFIPQWASSYEIEQNKREAMRVHGEHCGVGSTSAEPYAVGYVPAFTEEIFFNMTRASECTNEEHVSVENSRQYTGYYSWYNASKYCADDASNTITDPEVFLNECKFGFSCCDCYPSGDETDEFKNFKKCSLTSELLVKMTTIGVAKGGTMIAILGVGGMLTAPFFGIFSDKFNRVGAVGVALCINVVGYGMSAFVGDPTQGIAFLMAFIIGGGEVAGVISTQVLIQSRVEGVEIKGSVIGMFNLFGGVGILVNSKMGGFLFKEWRYAGPFIWVSILNIIIAVTCFLMMKGYAELEAKEKKDADLNRDSDELHKKVAPVNQAIAPKAEVNEAQVLKTPQL